MGDNTTITQKAAIGSDTIQIGTQNNNYYNGLTPTQASQLAINLFMDNFPKLQEAAMKTVQERVNELIREIVSKIEKNHAGDYSAFSMPDMQYILLSVSFLQYSMPIPNGIVSLIFQHGFMNSNGTV